MSETDSFIDEVSEEVRRDRLFATLKKYGWIGILAVVVLVAGASWNEWRKAQQRAEAEALGDSILAALERDTRTARAEALGTLETPPGAAGALTTLLAAGEQSSSDAEGSAQRLLALSDDPSVPQVYRQIAVLKAVAIPGSGLDPATRRERLEALVPGGGLVRLLAQEQLALLSLEEGRTDLALEQLRAVREDAEITNGLRQRIDQLIVALGFDPRPEVARQAEDGADQ
ncbi:MAG: hypothetical protein AAGA28_17915 [Pseudomonadota bacterium]